MSETLLGHTTAVDAVAARLRHEILAGVHPPGTRLRQDAIARRLGVSITPVREAFTLLRSEGLLRTDAHRGVQVFAPTVDDLSELYELRITLEGKAVAAAAHRVAAGEGRAELDRIAALLDRMPRIEDNEEYLAANVDLHEVLYELARMPRLAQLIAQLRDASSVYLHLFLVEFSESEIVASREQADREHTVIFDAILEGDAAKAQSLLEAHLRHSLEGMIELLGRFRAKEG